MSCPTTSIVGLIARRCSSADSTLERPTSAFVCRIWRWRLRDVDGVEVDDADLPDAGGGQVQRDRRAEPAGADHQHARVEQLALPGAADVGQDDVARVPLDLILGEPTASLT